MHPELDGYTVETMNQFILGIERVEYQEKLCCILKSRVFLAKRSSVNKTGWEKQTKSRMIFGGLKVFLLLSSSKNVFPFFPFLKNFQGLHIYSRILFGVLCIAHELVRIGIYHIGA